MSEQLIDLVTKKLLEKFGSGMHKPGSGSASAFQGMLSAQLLVTVIDLTNHADRGEKYKGQLTKLLEIQRDIIDRVYPALEKLFQEDSDHFDIVIGLRRERDTIHRNKDWLKYREKQEAADEALKIATDLPLSIAKICCELGKYAGDIFDYGFKSARGDSGVALQCAISAVASCLSIVELNLTKLPGDIWMEKIRRQKAQLKAQYLDLRNLGEAKLAVLEKQAEKNWQFQKTFELYRKGTLGKNIQTDQDMENLVRDFQNSLWINRDKIWGKGIITNAMNVLSPKDVLQKVLGYSFFQADSLGVHAIGDDIFEVAGVIDKNQRQVRVSKIFPEAIMNFTAAHELGHLILHEQAILHRDRPIDGSFSNIPKDFLEQQADKFAAYFLIPASVVSDVFFEMYGTQKLRIDEGVTLALAAGNVREFRLRCKDMRGFAIVIAQTELYGGRSFNSLAKIFGVSAGAMAIRLMELSLVEF